MKPTKASRSEAKNRLGLGFVPHTASFAKRSLVTVDFWPEPPVERHDLMPVRAAWTASEQSGQLLPTSVGLPRRARSSLAGVARIAWYGAAAQMFAKIWASDVARCCGRYLYTDDDASDDFD